MSRRHTSPGGTESGAKRAQLIELAQRLVKLRAAPRKGKLDEFWVQQNAQDLAAKFAAHILEEEKRDTKLKALITRMNRGVALCAALVGGAKNLAHALRPPRSPPNKGVRAMLLFEFKRAPAALREMSLCGGDEDGILLLPLGVEPPAWIERLWSCEANPPDEHLLPGGARMYIWSHRSRSH